MLKSFMQPGLAGNGKTDSNRTTPAGYSTKPEPVKPAAAPAPAPVAEPREAEPVAAPVKVASKDEGSKLIVGPNIKLKGSEITDCEILVVEGRVEASMNSRDIRIAEGGVFSGKAEIDVAEIRGTFEGELTARKRLVVYSTGRISGTIRYGALMVEEGGTIGGNMATHTAGSNLGKASVSAAPSPATDVVRLQDDEPLHPASLFGQGQKVG